MLEITFADITDELDLEIDSSWCSISTHYSHIALAFRSISKNEYDRHQSWLISTPGGKFLKNRDGVIYFEKLEDYMLYKMTWG